MSGLPNCNSNTRVRCVNIFSILRLLIVKAIEAALTHRDRFINCHRVFYCVWQSLSIAHHEYSRASGIGYNAASAGWVNKCVYLPINLSVWLTVIYAFRLATGPRQLTLPCHFLGDGGDHLRGMLIGSPFTIQNPFRLAISI